MTRLWALMGTLHVSCSPSQPQFCVREGEATHQGFFFCLRDPNKHDATAVLPESQLGPIGSVEASRRIV
ncbi:hypothetical protein A0H81_12097 [Grifola frondosa]|uniref:Uncharacterized protein n=1 Tax=Grifola frondosa TaxID=5627 RepID=A0A1C7LXN0_GRIFR|nr:hypothetical protein A0H81_12097 [Grifola frondosa]